MMKSSQLFIQFLIFSLIFNPFASAVVVDTNVFTTTDFATMKTVAASPTVLESKILVAGETSTMTTSLDNGKISVSDSVHTFREVSMDYQMLLDELEGFNGKQIALTHINDAGEIDSRRVVSVSPDANGYVSVIMEFSTTIVDGFTGYTTTTSNGLSGNKSISVPDGSSYDFNITNNQLGFFTFNGTNFTGRKLLNGTHSGAISTYQSNHTIIYESGMQADFDDIRFGYENGTEVPYWLENKVDGVSADIWFKSFIFDGNTPIWLYYGNDGLSSGSSIGNVFPLIADDFEGDLSNWIETGTPVLVETQSVSPTHSVYLDSTGNEAIEQVHAEQSGTYIIEYDFRLTVVNEYFTFYTLDGATTGIDIETYDGSLQYYDGSYHSITSISAHTWYHVKIVSHTSTDTMDVYVDDMDTAKVTGVSFRNSVTAPDTLQFVANGDKGYIDNVFIRKYNATKPTWTIGAEQTVSATINITASVIGDSNEQSYNTSQSRDFTLTPTGSTNDVLINTTSTDYDVAVTTYWTENTIKLTETAADGYANITVQYTPSNNITAGVINATYNTIDFAAHDYTGQLSVLVDDVDYSPNGTRLLNNVNTTIVNFDTSTHYINFSVPYNPALNLYSPNDTATLSYAYPPLTHDVVLSWEQSTGTYKYTVTDYDTGATVSSSTVSSNTTTIALPSGQYKWYVNGYDDVFDEYSPSSSIRSFTVADTFSYPNDTVVHGVVYEYILGVQTPLDTALVNIWNNTWSGSSMTGTNGYFVFQGLHNSTYSMRATKDGYIDSNIELVTPTFNTTLTRDILLQSSSGAGQLYVDHYVRFIVKSWYGTLYSGVDVNVYLGDAVVPQYTGTTGTDGSISFELNENQEYSITFISTLQNINEERTLYPKESEYTIIVFGANLIPDDRPSDYILFGCYGQSINLTHGYINVSFEDTSGTTTLAELWINDTDMTNLYYFNTTDSDEAWSQVVDGGNASYVVVFKLDNTVLDEPLVITRTIKFDNAVNVNLGLDEGWKYQLIAVIIISVIALLGSALNAEKMAVITVLVGWLMVFFGWLQAGATIPEQITLGLMMLFATLIAFGSVIRKGDER